MHRTHSLATVGKFFNARFAGVVSSVAGQVVPHAVECGLVLHLTVSLRVFRSVVTMRAGTLKNRFPPPH